MSVGGGGEIVGAGVSGGGGGGGEVAAGGREVVLVDGDGVAVGPGDETGGDDDIEIECVLRL